MKNLKLFAILLLLALTFSTLTSCALLSGGTTDTPGTSDNGNSTPNTDKGDDGNNEPPEEDIPVEELSRSMDQSPAVRLLLLSMLSHRHRSRVESQLSSMLSTHLTALTQKTLE